MPGYGSEFRFGSVWTVVDKTLNDQFIVRLVGGGATGRQFAFITGSKWAATFPQA